MRIAIVVVASIIFIGQWVILLFGHCRPSTNLLGIVNIIWSLAALYYVIFLYEGGWVRRIRKIKKVNQ